MVAVPGGWGWVSSLPRGARLLGSPSDTCVSQVAENHQKGLAGIDLLSGNGKFTDFP